jgi:serine/threonine protein kinase
MADRIGQQLGNYRLKSLLGRGGFAEVYLGEHIFLKTQAAIKVLLTQLSDEDMEGFLKESRTIANLNHPHIVRVLEFGVEENIPFLVMELAPNGSLRQRYSKNTRLEPSTVASYVKQIAGGLQYAHEQRVIHRDIKPENLLLGKRGEVLVGDFGIALLGQSSRYQSTQNVVGTVAYMSPEQIQGKARTASDQYSLGVVVYEWLTGERPFYGSFAELCAQHIYASPPSLRQKVPGISPVLEQVVMTALAKDPAKRFASIQVFATAFEQASQGRELLQEIMPTWVNTPAPSPSSPAASPQLSSTLMPGRHPTIHQRSQVDSTVPATSSGLASILPVSAATNALSNTLAAPTRVQPLMDTSAPTLAASTIASDKLATPVTPSPIPLTFPVTPPMQPRKRMSMVGFASMALALAIVLVSGVALWTHLGSASNGPTTALTPGLTMTPNGVVFVPTGTGSTTRVPVSSPTGHSGVLPSGTTRIFPTSTSGLYPTRTSSVPTATVGLYPTATTPPQPTPSPTPSPAVTCNTPSGSSFYDNYSSFPTGQFPAGYVHRGEAGVSPTIQQGNGSNIFNFPYVSNQYWDAWGLWSNLTMCNSYTVTAKLNFQTSGDRGGITIGWNDSNWNRIDIQINIFWQDIEFRIAYSGSNPSNPVVTGPGLSNGSLPMSVGNDYWLRVVASSTGPGQGQVLVYLSSDGVNFTQEVTATGLADITGWCGVSTAGPNLPNVWFENFQEQEN